jgi:hypothetical protein
VLDIVKAKSMLMPVMTNVTKTLSHVQKIVLALEIVQMVAHAVMMKLTVQIDHSLIISSTPGMTIGIISLGAKIILHQILLQMQTVNNTGLPVLFNAWTLVITGMTIAKLAVIMIHFAWTIALKQDNVASTIAHVKSIVSLAALA